MPQQKGDLDKPILIHVCKDRTLSYRNRFQPIFNKVALPIFSVNNVDEARELIPLVSNRQYAEHPLIPGDTWWKIDLGPTIHELDAFDDSLDKVADKLRAAYDIILSKKPSLQAVLAGEESP